MGFYDNIKAYGILRKRKPLHLARVILFFHLLFSTYSALTLPFTFAITSSAIPAGAGA